MEMADELEVLRREVDAWWKVGGRAHIKGELKERIVVVTKRAIEGGATHRHVSDILGLHASTLHRWLQVDAATRKVEGILREMKVIGDKPMAKAQARPTASLRRPPRLVLPNGVVLENLDTEQIITILRALR